jgi:hypothetical protein
VEGVGNELVSVLLADVKGVYGSPLHESQVSLCLQLTYDLAAYQNGAGRELAEAAYLLHVGEERRLIGMRRRRWRGRICTRGRPGAGGWPGGSDLVNDGPDPYHCDDGDDYDQQSHHE